MCRANVKYRCGHVYSQKVHCDRSRSKGGFGNHLKYALFEKPCDYEIPKKSEKICRPCESNLDDLRDYPSIRDEHRGENRERRSHDDRERTSDRSHGHREHRERRSHSDRERTSDRSHGHRERRHRGSDKPSSSKPSHPESHSSRSSRHRHRSSREERGRSTRPQGPMATIDESAPLPPRPGDELDERHSDDIADLRPVDHSGPATRDDGSSINDFRAFISAAERAEAEQRGPYGRADSSEPVSPLSADSPFRPASPVSPLIPDPQLPSSVYRPARADWQPQPAPRQQNNEYLPARPPSSMYSQPSLNPRTRVQQKTAANSSYRPASSVYSQPSVVARPQQHYTLPRPISSFPTRSSHLPRDSIAGSPVVSHLFPVNPVNRAGSVADSWITDYRYSDEEDRTSGQTTQPTSKNTTPRKNAEPTPRRSAEPRGAFANDPWAQNPYDHHAGSYSNPQENAEPTPRRGSGPRGAFANDPWAQDPFDSHAGSYSNPQENAKPTPSRSSGPRGAFANDPWAQDPSDRHAGSYSNPQENTEPTPRRSVASGSPRRTFATDPWTVDPFDRHVKNYHAKQMREEMDDQTNLEGVDFDIDDPNSPSNLHAPPNEGKPSRFAQLNADEPKPNQPAPMMHFSTYRDPNNPRPPPAPTPSTSGSQVFQNPRGAPAPPGPRDGLPAPNTGFNSHRLARKSVDNISHMTRWSDMCPPNVGANIEVAAHANIKPYHNGKPVHVVDPNIVKKSWGKADGPSSGKKSQRPAAAKNSSSNSKSWWSRLKPQASEASFACVDAAKHDSMHSQQRPESKKSGRSNDSKSKMRF